MAWLLIAGGFFALILCGLTGELVQTVVLHNTEPIAQRGAMSDLVIGGVVWAAIAAIVLVTRWRLKENKKLIAQQAAQARATDQAVKERERTHEKETRARRHLQRHIAAGGFTENIATTAFAREWEGVYRDIIYWETEIETLWRWRAEGYTSEEKISMELKEADERLDAIVRDWAVKHPGGPRPEVQYYDVK